MRRGWAALLGAVLLVVTGCATATDDELQPRPTPTVTRTGAPVQELPDRLELASDLDFSEQVVWSLGSRVSVDGDEVDLAGLVAQQVVVLDQGLLVLADERVWFVAGRRVVGLPLPTTRAIDLSVDGSQVVLRVADRRDPVAYTTAGARVDDDAVAAPRSPRRTVAGPGEYAVVPGADGPRVTDATGGAVAVQRLPDDLRVTGWTAADTFYGTGRLPGGEPPAGSTQVVRCTLAGPATCTAVGEVGVDVAEDLVFGEHPAG